MQLTFLQQTTKHRW